jgi:hypothetical protein
MSRNKSFLLEDTVLFLISQMWIQMHDLWKLRKLLPWLQTCPEYIKHENNLGNDNIAPRKNTSKYTYCYGYGV